MMRARPTVHVLWNYAYDMQMPFGVFGSLSNARAAWESIRDTGLVQKEDGSVIALATAELAGAWIIETYTPGCEPRELILQHNSPD